MVAGKREGGTSCIGILVGSAAEGNSNGGCGCRIEEVKVREVDLNASDDARGIG